MKITLIKKNPLCIPVIMAKELGIFEKHGVSVELTLQEDFNFGGKNPYMEGDSHAMMGDTTFFFYALEKGKKSVITSNLTPTIKVVGNKDVDLNSKGVKVGVNRAGLFTLFMERDLKGFLPSYERVWINNTYDRMEELHKGNIQALVAIEPFCSELVEKGYKVIWDSREGEGNFVMWCFDEEYYRNNSSFVWSFHKALNECSEIYNNSSKEERMRIVKEVCGYSESASKQFKDITFDNGENYSFKDFQVCQEWMFRSGEIKKQYDFNDVVVQCET